uniref:non-specific serine/threonine protein kinase n=1 Tax=Kalanchoe fedtschenkoi TaxID=63787 RepID=A0A7N0TQ98_KALFE
MWKFKPFGAKEQTGLEGRSIDVGNLKLFVRNVIAEGGFSCVYLARDIINASKQYALKHMICNDVETLDLVMKEIQILKSLKGHPNVVTIYAHSIMDMGRTKEAIVVMEYCEKSLVSVLETRGAGYFEEKQVLAIFRDVCNAVFAMHCQSPPIAHRDLKAENLLLGPDGQWKLCDFGSTSTNHKCFEKPEEMGIEEDNIRKHTTPAYRAPEMWDLFRREVISEKVDIWALGCLLYRICYFKSAFDGESKLQVLNGNYRIPELPKYSLPITNLIRDMLQASPDARPDITQVWFRVNEILPVGSQKSLPDRPPELQQSTTEAHEGVSKPENRSSPMPRRSPPPPPSYRETHSNISLDVATSKAGGAGGSMGAFWSTLHAKESVVTENPTEPRYGEPSAYSSAKHNGRNLNDKLPCKSEKPPSRDFEIKFYEEDPKRATVRTGASSYSESSSAFKNDAFNSFVAEFDTAKLSSGNNNVQDRVSILEAEIGRLKEQLKQTDLEKAEITSKYEKLTAICRTQRQEIQELKQTVSAGTSTVKDMSRNHNMSVSQPSATPQKEKIEGTVWELQANFINNPTCPEPKSWQAFSEDLKPGNDHANKSVRTRNGHQNKPIPETSSWGFETDSFAAVPTSTSQKLRPMTVGAGSTSQLFSELKTAESKQPAGWAGF